MNGDLMLDLIVFDANDVKVCNKTDLGKRLKRLKRLKLVK